MHLSRPVRLALLVQFLPLLLHAQLEHSAHSVFTQADTLRGSIGPERAWWDVTHYDVSVTPDYASRSIRDHHHLVRRQDSGPAHAGRSTSAAGSG
ncbi:MAG: hypothetical protein IPK99_07990 [Flavobacteriales bacterium]|nr:hypothetical protein [Flavobacteriales bacterium]